MKQFVFLLSAMVMMMISCKKDENPPVITVHGKNPDTVYVKTYGQYNDPGATAYDPEDGVVDLIIASNVNMQAVGHYLIFYSAKDKAGNVSEKKQRDVFVIRADGSFSVSENCASSGSQSYAVTVQSNAAADTITLKDFPVATFNTRAVIREGGYRIFPQSLGSVLQIEGEIQALHTDLNISYSRTSLIGPPATESCTAILKRN
jgi:hypothetical protein